ncbi:hypothetical protein DIC82_10780 [Clostridium beijerinckii]|nr:hypothetical protein DIC82_10780 [Clostridium beijerinckii]
MPLLRNLAKELAKNDWGKFLCTSPNDYFEEIILKGMVIGYVNTDIETILQYVYNFIPKIDNWAVCDSFCSGLKLTNAKEQYKE